MKKLIIMLDRTKPIEVFFCTDVENLKVRETTLIWTSLKLVL